MRRAPKHRGQRGAFPLLASAALALCLAAPGAQAAFDDPLFTGPPPPPPLNPVPPPTGYLNGPCGVAVDSAGDIYVADHNHDAVQVFSPGFAYRGQLAVEDPCYLALDSTDRLYVGAYHGAVRRYEASPSFGPGTQIDPGPATGIAVDPATDRLYVNHRDYVSAYEPDGGPVMDGAEPLAIGTASLGDAYGLAVSTHPATAGWLYVPDAHDDAVEVFHDPGAGPDASDEQLTGPSRAGRLLLAARVRARGRRARRRRLRDRPPRAPRRGRAGGGGLRLRPRQSRPLRPPQAQDRPRRARGDRRRQHRARRPRPRLPHLGQHRSRRRLRLPAGSGHLQRALRADDPARAGGRRPALRDDPDRRPRPAPLGDPLRGRRLPGAAPRARRPDAHHPPAGPRQPGGALPQHPQEMRAQGRARPRARPQGARSGQALSEGEQRRRRLGLPRPADRGRASGAPRAPPPRRARPRPPPRRASTPKPCRRFPAASRSRSLPTAGSPPRGPARTPTG